MTAYVNYHISVTGRLEKSERSFVGKLLSVVSFFALS
jgi:hypothetical protein